MNDAACYRGVAMKRMVIGCHVCHAYLADREFEDAMRHVRICETLQGEDL